MNSDWKTIKIFLESVLNTYLGHSDKNDLTYQIDRQIIECIRYRFDIPDYTTSFTSRVTKNTFGNYYIFAEVQDFSETNTLTYKYEYFMNVVDGKISEIIQTQ